MKFDEIKELNETIKISKPAGKSKSVTVFYQDKESVLANQLVEKLTKLGLFVANVTNSKSIIKPIVGALVIGNSKETVNLNAGIVESK